MKHEKRWVLLEEGEEIREGDENYQPAVDKWFAADRKDIGCSYHVGADTLHRRRMDVVVECESCPKCGQPLKDARGIGPVCTTGDCPVNDDAESAPPEPATKLVEVEVAFNSDWGALCFFDPTEKCTLAVTRAVTDPRFRGYKFEGSDRVYSFCFGRKAGSFVYGSDSGGGVPVHANRVLFEVEA